MSDERRRLWGRVCLWAGIIGAVQGVVLAAVPAQVDSDRWSYPFDVTGHVVAQVSFFVQHLGLVAGLVALCSLPSVKGSRPTRWGLWAGTAGMVLLAVQELVAIAPARELTTSDLAELVGGLYTVPLMLIGIGLLVGGIGLARRCEPTSPVALRWLPAVLGVWVFVPLMPSLFAPFVFGRIAIGVWMLLFAALGWGLARTPESAWRAASVAGREQAFSPAMS